MSKPTREGNSKTAVALNQTLLTIIAFVLVALSVMALFGWFRLTPEKLNTSLLSFLLAGVLLLAPRLQSLKYGDLEVVLEKLQKAEQDAAVAMDAALHGVGKRPAAIPGMMKASSAQVAQRSAHNDDPHKGMFGGSAFRDPYKLSATATRIEGTEYFELRFRVASTNAQRPLTGDVEFFLHPTFVPDSVVVKVINGVAELTRVAWGSFTVGATTADKVNLELDVSNMPDIPASFRDR